MAHIFPLQSSVDGLDKIQVTAGSILGACGKEKVCFHRLRNLAEGLQGAALNLALTKESPKSWDLVRILVPLSPLQERATVITARLFFFM